MTNEELSLFELDFEYELLGDDIEAFKAIVDDYIAAEPTEENNDDLRRFFFTNRQNVASETLEMIIYAANTLEFEATAVPLALLEIRGKYISTLKAYKKTTVYELMNDDTIEFYNDDEKIEYTSELTSKALQYRDRAFIKEVRAAVARIKDVAPIKEQ